MTPTLTRVVRLDSLPLNQTFFTDEGYLIDRPILTSTGIFEYKNKDGSVRRELRLPEEVFHAESLKSYKGKPVIITHSAGLVTKDNVERHCIGTILTEGYRSGDDVRAEIVIHDTDAMKESGLRELSLGYDLDLDETPGEWNGMPYDAIQRNIRINHLALVGEARAGKQARLNIDGRDDENILEGGKSEMSNEKLSQDQLAEAIADYKAKRAKAMEKADGDKPVVSTEPDVVVSDGADEPKKELSIEERLQMVKDNRERRNQDGDPELSTEEIIARQDSDMDELFDIIGTLMAAKDASGNNDSATEPAEEPKAEEPQADGADEPKPEDEPAKEEPANTDGDEPAGEDVTASDCGNKDGEPVEKPEEGEEPQADGADEPAEEPAKDEPAEEPQADCDDPKKKQNMDAADIDRCIRERVKLGIVGKELHLDGLEDMDIREAKIAVIDAIQPGMHFDGKEDAYVNAAYDMAMAQRANAGVKDTNDQRRQMFNKDSNDVGVEKGQSAFDARQAMIERKMNR